MDIELYSQIALIAMMASVLMVVLTSNNTSLNEKLILTNMAILAGMLWPMSILCIIIVFFSNISSRT